MAVGAVPAVLGKFAAMAIYRLQGGGTGNAVPIGGDADDGAWCESIRDAPPP
jgi:hypothetical protein